MACVAFCCAILESGDLKGYAEQWTEVEAIFLKQEDIQSLQLPQKIKNRPEG